MNLSRVMSKARTASRRARHLTKIALDLRISNERLARLRVEPDRPRPRNGRRPIDGATQRAQKKTPGDRPAVAAASTAAASGPAHESRQFVPPGHFYSPIPALDEIRRDEDRIFATPARTLPGIDLREGAQLDLLREFLPFYEDMPFAAETVDGLRYHFRNRMYSYSDGIMLHCMLRWLRPSHIIEIGSGYSSCMTLDTNERFLGGEMQTTFIEPYPDLLHSLLGEGDRERVEIIVSRLQDVDLEVFGRLGAGDVLFVDSTHVSRVDSDVNRVLFDIMPRLQSGVYIHFHDIMYPFEYPREWIYGGRAWNEAYALRAFLQYNDSFEVVLFNTFMEQFHEEFFAANMPLCLENRGGSIWLRRR